MKKHLLIFILITFGACSGILYSQDRIFKPFKFDIAGLMDIPLNNESGMGGGFALEPRYSINDNFVMGIRFEGVYFNNNDVAVGISGFNVSTEVEQWNMNALMLTGDYYFGLERVRPFIGMGIGAYRKNITTTTTDVISFWQVETNVSNDSETQFGVSPRVGINISHFKLAAIMNISGRKTANYIGLQVGIEIGGGYN